LAFQNVLREFTQFSAIVEQTHPERLECDKTVLELPALYHMSDKTTAAVVSATALYFNE